VKRRFWASLYFALLPLLLSIPGEARAQSCGVERWSVKTGTDPDAGQVNLGSSTPNTVATMRSWPAPNPIPPNNRVSPYETTVWVLNATLTLYKLEGDSDYHLVLRDASGNTMIAEIPRPSCVGAASPFRTAIQNARAEFDARYTATTSFQTANVPVQITGVGMFDFLHGQTGVAPNGIEIHPVLDVVFNPSADFAISTSPTSLSIVQGSSDTSTVSTTVSGGFNSTIFLSASGLPSGVTAGFAPPSLPPPGSGSSTVTLSVASTTAPGTYSISLTGNGGGLTHSTSLSLTVTPASNPDFAVAVSPPSVSIVQGGNGTSTVTTTISGGFNAAIGLSASGLPAGVNAVFNPPILAAPGSGSSILTLSADPTTAVGGYTVTVTGTGGGLTRSTSLTLTVTPAGTPDFVVSASPPSLSIVQGGNGTSTVTTTISGGFNAAIGLSASGLPAGAGAVFNPPTLAAPGAGSSTLTLSADSTTAVGGYTVTVTGTGGGLTRSTNISLNVTSSGTPTEAMTDGGFEDATVSGLTAPGWNATTNISGHNVIIVNGPFPRTGTNYSALGENNNARETLTQTVVIPSSSTAASLTFWANVVTQEPPSSGPYDFLFVEIHDSSGTLLATPLTLDNNSSALSNNTDGIYFQPSAVDLFAYRGQTIQIVLHATTDYTRPTTFRIDDVSLLVTVPADPNPPTTSITAPTDGSTVSGTTTVMATASDDVGVARIELYIDGALTASNTGSTQLSYAWDTTSVANGSHVLASKAYDAEGNPGVSPTVTVTVSNGGGQQLLANPGFESGTASWTATSGVIGTATAGEPAHTGNWRAWLDGYGTTHTDTLYQQVLIPSSFATATLTFWLHIDTAETTTTVAYDTLKVQIRNPSGTVLATLATLSNLDAAPGYQQRSFDVSAYRGQTVRIYLLGVEDYTRQTSFVVDDFALIVQ